MASLNKMGKSDGKWAVVFMALALALYTGCTSSKSTQSGSYSASSTGGLPDAEKLPDMSQAQNYSIYNSNIKLSQRGDGGFYFEPALLGAVGNFPNVTIGTHNAGTLTATQRAHTAMKAAWEIQRATGAEGVLLYLSLGDGLPKISYSVATVAYAPTGYDWKDGAGVQVWDVEVTDTQVEPEAIRLAQEVKNKGANTALPIPQMRRKDYVAAAGGTSATRQKSSEARLFELVGDIIVEGEKEHPYSVETAKDLIENGADVNARDSGQTPLLRAAQNGHIGIMKVLLEHGADVNARDDNGRTALMVAAGATDPDMVQLLLSKGADVSLKDNDGFTAWSGSEMIGGSSDPQYLRMRRLLKKAGAK